MVPTPLTKKKKKIKLTMYKYYTYGLNITGYAMEKAAGKLGIDLGCIASPEILPSVREDVMFSSASAISMLDR